MRTFALRFLLYFRAFETWYFDLEFICAVYRYDASLVAELLD